MPQTAVMLLATDVICFVISHLSPTQTKCAYFPQVFGCHPQTLPSPFSSCSLARYPNNLLGLRKNLPLKFHGVVRGARHSIATLYNINYVDCNVTCKCLYLWIHSPLTSPKQSWTEHFLAQTVLRIVLSSCMISKAGLW